MKVITFERDGFEFVISKFENIGTELKGMSTHKIFTDKGWYYKNHKGYLLRVLKFEIFQKGQLIDPETYAFDTPTRVAAIITCRNKVLVIHRIKKEKEYWVYPGGHLKQNETILEGVIREIKEETNIDITNFYPKLFLELDGKVRGFGQEKYFKVQLRDFPTDMFDKNPEDTRHVSDVIWVDIEKAKSLENLYPREVIGKLVSA
jgi:8-oxo-dGTP pyrophosphatase MutT (NUDIX family)